MIRPAKHADTPALLVLLTEAHAQSRFATDGFVSVDMRYAQKLLGQLIQRHGHTHDGGSCVFVFERDGVIEGFIAGVLDRVYHIGDMLQASDMFLFARAGRGPIAPLLIEAYIDWSSANPHVLEIMLSWSDALDSGAKAGALYERMGFTRCGAMYRRDRVVGCKGKDNERNAERP
jgi:GNAT superfamily N-acetyltransferase